MPQTTSSVLCTTLQVLAVLVTILRLGYRGRTHMFWVEDMWAVAALVCGVTSLIAGCISIYAATDGSQLAVICFWVHGLALLSTIWAVRQSILFSVARLFWSVSPLRSTAITIACVFLVLYGALVTQKAWQYGHHLDWHHHPDKNGQVHAHLTHSMIIFELITGCVSDVIIALLALHLLWGIKLPAKERMIVLAALSASIIVTIVSVFRAVCQLEHLGGILRIAIDLELAVSLVACNLSVATTYIYRTATHRRRSVSESKSDSDIVFSQEVVSVEEDI